MSANVPVSNSPFPFPTRAAEPWEQPAGHLAVQLRYPACLLEEASILTCLAPQPVHLLGSSSDVVAAALAAGSVAGMLNHRREAAEMAAAGLLESSSPGSALESSSSNSSGESGGCPSRCTSNNSSSSTCTAVGPLLLAAAEGARGLSALWWRPLPPMRAMPAAQLQRPCSGLCSGGRRACGQAQLSAAGC